MKQYKINHDLAQSIMQYLGERPMVEVEQMVNGLRSLEPIEAPEPARKSKKKPKKKGRKR